MLDQIGIALFGVTAVFLSQTRRESFRRWACIFGLIGQPFWFYSAFTHQQWGIFGLSFLYTFAWGQGVFNNWLRPWYMTR